MMKDPENCNPALTKGSRKECSEWNDGECFSIYRIATAGVNFRYSELPVVDHRERRTELSVSFFQLGKPPITILCWYFTLIYQRPCMKEHRAYVPEHAAWFRLVLSGKRECFNYRVVFNNRSIRAESQDPARFYGVFKYRLHNDFFSFSSSSSRNMQITLSNVDSIVSDFFSCRGGKCMILVIWHYKIWYFWLGDVVIKIRWSDLGSAWKGGKEK